MLVLCFWTGECTVGSMFTREKLSVKGLNCPNQISNWITTGFEFQLYFKCILYGLAHKHTFFSFSSWMCKEDEDDRRWHKKCRVKKTITLDDRAKPKVAAFVAQCSSRSSFQRMCMHCVNHNLFYVWATNSQSTTWSLLGEWTLWPSQFSSQTDNEHCKMVEVFKVTDTWKMRSEMHFAKFKTKP